MAVDVIVRPQGRCVTVVGDVGMRMPDAIVLSGSEIEGREGGCLYHIGVLTDVMAQEAALCSIAVLVVMDGPSVRASREVALVHRDAG